MVALPLLALEEALKALLIAIGVGLGAAAASDAVKKRQKAVSEAGTSDVATTATQARSRACEKCPPECGAFVERNWHMSAAAREYQARVTGFAPGIEWHYGGLDFDGFSSAECMLKEAKSRYDQFLTEGEDAELEPKKWYRAFEQKMLPQAERQATVARSAPPARLTWYFQGPRAYGYMASKVMEFPPLVAVLIP